MSARLSGDREAGFTLIELLVVMLILGILAAIAIPAFFNQRDKANDAQAKAAARTAQTAIETYATEHGGSYAGADADALIAIEPTLVKTGDNAISVTNPTATGYTVTSTSSKSHAFSITRAGGVVTFPCTPKGGGCTNTADWSE
ncbi:MAG: type II secretion system protein [Solirubrobacterales bacterium]